MNRNRAPQGIKRTLPPATPPQWQARPDDHTMAFRQVPVSQFPPQPPINPYGVQYVPPKPAKKKPRIFLWVFLAIQALFLIWLVAGIINTSHTGADAHAAAVHYCSLRSNWQFLYPSQADCITHYGNALNGASDAGKTIGAAFIVIVWVVIDFFMGLGFLIYKLSKRSLFAYKTRRLVNPELTLRES